MDMLKLYFSDVFEVSKQSLKDYGTIDLSLASDLPMFIDPFLLFNSDKEEYQQLHNNIIEYLRFLRDKSLAHATLSEGQLRAWYYFSEVKQNWLGFTFLGNGGSGLGRDFAIALHDNLHAIFSTFGNETVSTGSHLEKLCLVKDNVGKDNISDFTSNLIKEYLLDYTQAYAQANIKPEYLKQITIRRVRFNYTTETWADKTYTLPWYMNDFVLLTPRDMLTKDDTWINKQDLVSDFNEIPEAIPNEQLREQINNYFASVLPTEASKKERDEAVIKTIREFPQLIDYYIKHKEQTGEQASEISGQKVEDIERKIDDAQELSTLLSSDTDFYQQPASSLDEAIERSRYLKHCIEDRDGYLIINPPLAQKTSSEKIVQLVFTLVWFGSIYDFNREPNNGRGPVDATVSMGSLDKTIVEFKLAKNTKLRHGLEKQTRVYLSANNTKKKVVVIVCYTEQEQLKVSNLLSELGLSGEPNIVVIDARNDNKPSASRA